MGKRKVKNSLPPTALEKKAQSKRTLLNTAKDRPERRSFLYGRSEVIRTPGILLPNFFTFSSALWPFLFYYGRSSQLLTPLFPHTPHLSVVKHVVKNASRPVSGEGSPVPNGKRFAFLCGVYCNSAEGVMQVVSAWVAAQSLRGNKQRNSENGFFKNI